jgi:amino acid efflux transporter
VATYVRNAFGARAATVVGWSFYFAVPVGAPAAALFAGAYVESALGGGTRTTLLTAGAMMLAVTAGNLGGVRVSGRLQLGLAALLVTLLLTATLTALPHASAANLHPFAPHGWWAVGPAAAVLVWGFAGWEAVTSLAADFRRPERDLPRATAIALVVVGVLYLGIAAASVLVLGPSAGEGEAPLAELLATGVGGQVRTQIHATAAAAAVLLTLGTMNAYYAGAAKLGAALGRDGALPAWFARGAAPGSVPRRSLLVIALLGAASLGAVAVSGTGTRALVLLTSGCFVVVYLMGSAAAVRLLPRRSVARRCAAISLVASAGLMLLTGWYVLGTLVIAAGALLYASLARRPSGPPAKISDEISGRAVDSAEARLT